MNAAVSRTEKGHHALLRLCSRARVNAGDGERREGGTDRKAHHHRHHLHNHRHHQHQRTQGAATSQDRWTRTHASAAMPGNAYLAAMKCACRPAQRRRLQEGRPATPDRCGTTSEAAAKVLTDPVRPRRSCPRSRCTARTWAPSAPSQGPSISGVPPTCSSIATWAQHRQTNHVPACVACMRACACV